MLQAPVLCEAYFSAGAVRSVPVVPEDGDEEQNDSLPQSEKHA